MPKIGKVTKISQAIHIIEGLTKHFERAEVIVLGGERFTRQDLIDLFQAHIDAIKNVDATSAAASAAVARERQVAARVLGVGRLLRKMVFTMVGPSPVDHADFGWEVPRRPGPKTVASKLQGAQKARETRKARGTMGKRQRRKIRGW